MKIIIKIMIEGKIVDYETLTKAEKKEIGTQLNEQGLKALGYERKRGSNE